MDKTINYADLIGVQFKNRGRDITSGVDCYGLVMEVYRRFGIDLPEFTADFDDVEKINSLICTEAVKTSVWREVSKGEISAPCIIAIRFGAPPGIVNHTGWYIGNGKFIHIRENIGVCIDHIESPAWRKVIVGFYEYIGDRNGKAGNR